MSSDEYDYDYEYESDDSSTNVVNPVADISAPNFDGSIDSQYSIFTSSNISTKCDEVITELKNFLGDLSNAHILRLLNFYKWDREKLTESYIEDDSRCLKLANCPKNTGKAFKVKKLGECQICFSNFELISNPNCGHFYCRVCYSSYVKHKILDDGLSAHIPCPDPSCKLELNPSFLQVVLELIESNETLERYRQLSTVNLLKSNLQTLWCASPNCGSIFWVEDRNHRDKRWFQ